MALASEAGGVAERSGLHFGSVATSCQFVQPLRVIEQVRHHLVQLTVLAS
jgi:hypothetical protein